MSGVHGSCGQTNTAKRRGGECVGANVRYAMGGGWEGVMAKRVVPLAAAWRDYKKSHAMRCQTETQSWAETRGMGVNLAFWVTSFEI